MKVLYNRITNTNIYSNLYRKIEGAKNTPASFSQSISYI